MRKHVVATAVIVALLPAASSPAAERLMNDAFVRITAAGPQPRDLHVRAGAAVPAWISGDAREHVVQFADGRCTIAVSPGHPNFCTDIFWEYVGAYPYTVTNTAHPDGVVTVEPLRRSVTLAASRAVVRPRERVVLSGTLFLEAYRQSTPTPFVGGGLQTTILMRAPSARRWTVLARILPHERQSESPTSVTLAWHVAVRPRRTMLYLARNRSQPPGGVVWERAQSRVVRVVVRSR